MILIIEILLYLQTNTVHLQTKDDAEDNAEDNANSNSCETFVDRLSVQIPLYTRSSFAQCTHILHMQK